MSATGPTESRIEFNRTQLGLARRFVELFGDDLRYSYARRRWLFWDGRRWIVDEGHRVEALMKKTVDAVFVEAAESEPGVREPRSRFALMMEKRTEQKAALELARSEPGIPIDQAELDSKPWLLNVRNGTIDLRDGSLREHRREDLLTHLCDIQYDVNAQAPRWEQFLEEIIPDPEVRGFLKKAVGYSLTGDTREQVFFIGYGSGANGKSVFFEIIIALMADLATKCPSDTIARRRSTGIPNDIARLVGKRVAVAVELEDGFRLAEAQIKQLVGGDTTSARFMRGEWFDFRPVCKLWLASNYRPKIRGTDYGMWRRVLLIPFGVTITNPDRNLIEKLREELSGILAWAIEGCLEWQEDGLEPPESVRFATDAYKSSEDIIGRFLDEECTIDPVRTVRKGDLYSALESWCVANGEDTPTKRQLVSRLENLGITPRRTSEARMWVGVGLGGSQ